MTKLPTKREALENLRRIRDKITSTNTRIRYDKRPSPPVTSDSSQAGPTSQNTVAATDASASATVSNPDNAFKYRVARPPAGSSSGYGVRTSMRTRGGTSTPEPSNTSGTEPSKETETTVDEATRLPEGAEQKKGWFDKAVELGERLVDTATQAYEAFRGQTDNMTDDATAPTNDIESELAEYGLDEPVSGVPDFDMNDRQITTEYPNRVKFARVLTKKKGL